MYVNWQDLKETILPHDYTNVVIAAFGTAQARLKLYSCLEVLQKRALYFVTDSILITQRPGDPQLQLGTS